VLHTPPFAKKKGTWM